jgi:hypothetical protein
MEYEMKFTKKLIAVVSLMFSNAAFAGSGSKVQYVPEPIIINSTKPCMIQIDKNTFINANHISSIYVGTNSYYDKEKSSFVASKYIYKPALIYIVGKITHSVELDNPTAEQMRILEVINKTCNKN